jgi:hypothetical protein
MQIKTRERGHYIVFMSIEIETFLRRWNRDRGEGLALGSFTFNLDRNHARRPSVQTFDIQTKEIIDSLTLKVSADLAHHLLLFRQRFKPVQME